MSENILQPVAQKNLDAVLSDEEYAALPTLAGADPKLLAEAIAEVLDSRRGRDVKVIFVEDKTEIADYFVLCTGNSSTHVKSLLGEVEHKISLRGVVPHHVEGRDNSAWLIADYSHVLVHIFSREAREFYNLDKLYGDGSSPKTADTATLQSDF